MHFHHGFSFCIKSKFFQPITSALKDDVSLHILQAMQNEFSINLHPFLRYQSTSIFAKHPSPSYSIEEIKNFEARSEPNPIISKPKYKPQKMMKEPQKSENLGE